MDNISAVEFTKVDEELGLVFGYAIVCKINGQDYYDQNRNPDTGESEPDHIPEDSMLKAATDFMINSRAGKQMHVGDVVGQVVFAWPMTTEIAKMFDFDVKQTGLLIAWRPDDGDLTKFKDGTFKGFSIGGSYGETEYVDA